MAVIILEFCPRCLRRSPKFVNPPSFSSHVPCGTCRSETEDQARAGYASRLAKAKVWYTVPETYDNVLY